MGDETRAEREERRRERRERGERRRECGRWRIPPRKPLTNLTLTSGTVGGREVGAPLPMPPAAGFGGAACLFGAGALLSALLLRRPRMGGRWWATLE